MAKLDVIAEFCEDHRKMMDMLLGMIDALGVKDVAKAREILGELNTIAGPHGKFEEDAFFPALRVFLGENVDSLVKEHDGIIETAKACAALLEKDSITDEEAKQAVDATRKMLAHVSNCEGLEILSKRLESSVVDGLADSFAADREAGVSLLEWADSIRKPLAE